MRPVLHGAAARRREAPTSLLRDVLARTQKAGIAKVVIRTRQHLAAVKANGNLLVLELLHFADELVNPATLAVPAKKIRRPARDRDGGDARRADDHELGTRTATPTNTFPR